MKMLKKFCYKKLQSYEVFVTFTMSCSRCRYLVGFTLKPLLERTFKYESWSNVAHPKLFICFIWLVLNANETLFQNWIQFALEYNFKLSIYIKTCLRLQFKIIILLTSETLCQGPWKMDNWRGSFLLLFYWNVSSRMLRITCVILFKAKLHILHSAGFFPWSRPT